MKMGKIIIMASDAGKYDLKASGRNAEGNSYKVELDGKTFIIGEQDDLRDLNLPKIYLNYKDLVK